MLASVLLWVAIVYSGNSVYYAETWSYDEQGHVACQTYVEAVNNNGEFALCAVKTQ